MYATAMMIALSTVGFHKKSCSDGCYTSCSGTVMYAPATVSYGCSSSCYSSCYSSCHSAKKSCFLKKKHKKNRCSDSCYSSVGCSASYGCSMSHGYSTGYGCSASHGYPTSYGCAASHGGSHSYEVITPSTAPVIKEAPKPEPAVEGGKRTTSLTPAPAFRSVSYKLSGATYVSAPIVVYSRN